MDSPLSKLWLPMPSKYTTYPDVVSSYTTPEITFLYVGGWYVTTDREYELYSYLNVVGIIIPPPEQLSVMSSVSTKNFPADVI